MQHNEDDEQQDDDHLHTIEDVAANINYENLQRYIEIMHPRKKVKD